MLRFVIAMALGGMALGCNKTTTIGDGGGAGSGLFDDFFGDVVPDRSEYVFPDSCPATDDLDMCGECCTAEGFDSPALYGTDCGCQNTESNDTLCTPSANADACDSCCTAGGYTGYFYLGGETSGDCSCLRSTKEPHAS